MSSYAGRGAYRFIQTKAGYVSVAALLCLSGAVEKLTAQTAEPVPPTGQTTTDPKPDVPLPTVTVQTSRPRPTTRPQPARPATTRAPTPPPPPPPATTVETTSPTGTNYQTTNPGIGRVGTSLLNTPQSINVISQQVLRETGSSSLRDALRTVAGVTFRAGEGGNQGDTPYIRGFSAQNDVFRDGIRDPGFYNRDSFDVDAVEVYKGPASFLFGRGSTGGVINLISKTPLDRNFIDVAVTGNTGLGGRVQVDANKKIDENFSARFVGMGQRYNIAGRDHVEENRWGVAPSLKWQANRTKVTLSYIYQHENSVPDYGIPFLQPGTSWPRAVAPVPRNTWYGILSGTPDHQKDNIHVATGKIEHEFNNNVKLTNTTRYQNVNHEQLNVFPEPNTSVPSPSNLNVNWNPNRNQVNVTNAMWANTTDLLAKFATGPLDHTVAAGIDAYRETRDFYRVAFAGQAATNFVNPDPWRFGGVAQPPAVNNVTYGVANNIGVFAADQVKITKYLELLGGVRYDQFRFTQDAPLAAASVQHLGSTNNLTSWRAGVVVHPIENTSVYVMRGTSFNPSADNMTIGVGATPVANANALSLVSLAPEKNETTEIGAKADVLNGKLSLAAAAFRTLKTNLRVLDPATSAFTALQGVITSTGWEASATGKLTDQWQMIASYTHVHARVTQTLIAAQLNNEPMNTPTHSFSLWSTYDVTPQWQVGGGAFHSSAAFGDLPNTAQIPGYWRFDAMAAYKVTKNITAQFNIYNLTNQYYFNSAYSNWGVPGASRTFAVTMRGTY